MPESITTKSAPQKSTGQKPVLPNSAHALNQDFAKTNVSASALKSLDLDLKNLSKPETETANSKQLTVGELTEKKVKEAQNEFRNRAALGLNAFGVGASLLSGSLNLFNGGEGPLTKLVDSFANKIVKANFMGLAAFGGSDAIRRKSPQLIPQGLAVFTPMFSSADDLTMNRGYEVGSMTLAAGMEQLGAGKEEGYENYKESNQLMKDAFVKFLKALKENPLKAILDTKSGTGAMFSGLATMTAPIINAMGFDKAASIVRQGFGIALEFVSKLNIENLRKGRFALFFSGLLMTVSSLFNAFKPFASKRSQKAIENFTWAFNLVGKQAQLQAYNVGELAYSEDKDFKVSELPGLMIKAALGFNTNQAPAAVPVIGNAQEQASVETKTSSSGKSYFNLRPSSVRSSKASKSLNSGKQGSSNVPKLNERTNKGKFIGGGPGFLASTVRDMNTQKQQKMQPLGNQVFKPMTTVRPLTDNTITPVAKTRRMVDKQGSVKMTNGTDSTGSRTKSQPKKAKKAS